jgi:hypothetical protein
MAAFAFLRLRDNKNMDYADKGNFSAGAEGKNKSKVFQVDDANNTSLFSYNE